MPQRFRRSPRCALAEVPDDLTWRELTSQDIAAVHSWVCADPPKRQRVLGATTKTHPKEWELEVQSHFRDARWRSHGVAWSGWNGNEVIALAHLTLEPSGDAAFIPALGCAVRARGSGVGDALIEECLRLTSGGDERLTASAITAMIRPGNTPSKALFKRHGFECELTYDDGMELWARPI